MSHLHIALCEDDATERSHLQALLDNSGYELSVSSFASGEEFLAQFQPEQYDLILMDIFMDKLTGIDVITHVRTIDDQVPVAFITTSMDFTRESYQLDAIKYIEKPVTAKSVKNLLQMAQLQRQSVDTLDVHINNTPVSIPLHRILYLEQQVRNLVIYQKDGKHIIPNKKIADVEPQLLDKHFLRCHKSYLVNLAHVCGINRELHTFELPEGNMVHIRRESFAATKKAFETYLFAKSQEVPHG
ncbi:LytTR family DNA-binding domain-containing protein [Bengtsoniella intestinalis]|uniref:LytR/AlgR family response regulator transcription factor n=1 Tax=Bengtsoniella intestinalis TaxID=3073143 RepID=UPI00391EFDE7